MAAGERYKKNLLWIKIGREEEREREYLREVACLQSVRVRLGCVYNRVQSRVGE